MEQFNPDQRIFLSAEYLFDIKTLFLKMFSCKLVNMYYRLYHKKKRCQPSPKLVNARVRKV